MSAPSRRRPTREYGKFPVAPHAKRRQLNIDSVPPEVYQAVRAKCAREGRSFRAVVLELLTAWSHQ